MDFNVILKVGKYFLLSFNHNVNKNDVNKQLLPFFCKNNTTPIGQIPRTAVQGGKKVTTEVMSQIHTTPYHPFLWIIISIFKAGLSRSYDGWAKYEEKVPDVSDPIQNVETTCNSKLKFT